MKTWTNGNIIEGKNTIDSFNYTLHYSAPSAWEGVRSYLQEDGSTKIWKLREHSQRLLDTAKILGFEIPYSLEQIEKAITDTVLANGGGDLYIRPIAYCNMDADGIHSEIKNITLDIYCKKFTTLHADANKGISMAISHIVRGYPQFQMQAKTPSNYQVVQLVKKQMKALQVQDMFLLDNNGYVVEATVSNFWVFKGNYAMTPPNAGSILPGVTRACVADILGNQAAMFSKYKRVPIVVEKNITRADLYTADCVVLCGTYAEIVNVLNVDGKEIGSPEKHAYFDILSKEYAAMVKGKK